MILKLVGPEKSDPKAGEVEFEISATVTRAPDGGLTTAIDYIPGNKPRAEAAEHLKLAAAHMEDREAEVSFSLVMGRDPGAEDPAFPWRWSADWYVATEDPELVDLSTRVDILRRVLASYEADGNS